MLSETQLINATAVSPADSSLWIATSARGLVRVGRNGKAFSYSVEKGDMSCNNIVALAFDADGVLWMKDAEGGVFSYTSFTGFVKQTAAPEGLAKVLSGPVTKVETVVEMPSQAPQMPVQRPWYGSWWIPALAILFFALFIWQLLKNRRGVTKSVSAHVPASATPAAATPTVTPAAAITPAQSAAATQSVTPSAVTPAAAPKPAVPKQPAQKPAASRQPAPKSASPKAADGEFAAEVMQIVKTNFTNPEFGVEDVAAALGISRVHLNRKLKAENSPSPSDMIKSMRMELASEMLKAGGKTIAEVAEASGFSSASYFSSAFKEYFGVAPAVYGK